MISEDNHRQTPLTALLAGRIAQKGPITFHEFMESALYHPEHGYYAAGKARIGRRGDFFTAVSAGALFGKLLARQFAEMWRSLGRPAIFTLVEQGANDGTLAADILQALETLEPECWPSVRLIIVEPMARLREAQERKLARWTDRVRWVVSWEEMTAFVGVFYCNELVDAFPVHRVRWTSKEGWEELYVGCEGGQFVWQTGKPSSPELASTLQSLPLPCSAEVQYSADSSTANYTTELRPAAAAWMSSVARHLQTGWALIIDYGYTREEYYRPERTEGTLSGYHQQTRASNLLANPGEIDLTAHVDFTTLIESAERAGMKIQTFTEQGRYLSALSTLHFRDTEDPNTPARLKEIRQFQTLTHPELMGAAFKVLCMAKGTAAGE